MSEKTLGTDFSNPNHDWFSRNLIYDVEHNSVTKNIFYPCAWE